MKIRASMQVMGALALASFLNCQAFTPLAPQSTSYIEKGYTNTNNMIKKSPFIVGPTVSSQPSQTQLSMGVIEDFLAGTDKETRKKENESYLQALNQRVERINALETNIEDLGDEELVAKTAEFRKRLADGEDINGPILEEAFAVVREAAWYVCVISRRE